MCPNIKIKKNIGPQGEDIAAGFISQNDFEIIERNHRRKWGEIDIVAKKHEIFHFFEVKSVSRSRKTKSPFDPLDNVHKNKVSRLRKIIQTYLVEQGKGYDADFYFHVLCVYINTKNDGDIEIVWLDNVIL